MNTIGVRLYRVAVRGGDSRSELRFSDEDMNVMRFVRSFLRERKSAVTRDDRLRRWYVDHFEVDEGMVRGVLKYGHYGYESDIVDSETSEERYKRKSSDVEQIPLYFSFWIPKKGGFGIAAFQSFQGRSCIDIFTSDIAEQFTNRHHECKLLFHKVMPGGAEGMFLQKPVKKLYCMKKHETADHADKLRNLPIEDFNVEVKFSARRRKNFGILRDVLEELRGEGGAQTFIYGGVEFEEAYAEVNVGGKPQRIGVFGYSTNSGVIDVTDDVEIENGHPTFETISEVVDDLIVRIHSEMTTGG